MSNLQATANSWGARVLWAVRNFFATTIALVVFLLATFLAIMLTALFVAMWYVFFATPVFGDLLGVMGGRPPATPPTTWTLVFVGAMALFAAAACYLIFQRWNQWRRNILHRRRSWLGLA